MTAHFKRFWWAYAIGLAVLGIALAAAPIWQCHWGWQGNHCHPLWTGLHIH
jgi:hypothetical protein